MRNLEVCKMVALVAIAIATMLIAFCLTLQTLSLARTETEVSAIEKTEMAVLPVITKAYVNHDVMGCGSTGFIVQNGEGLGFVGVDEDSRLDAILKAMPQPQYLLRLTRGETEILQPLFLSQSQ